MEDLLQSRIRSRNAYSLHTKQQQSSHQQGSQNTLKILSHSLHQQQQSQQLNQLNLQRTESRFQIIQPKHIQYIGLISNSIKTLNTSSSPEKIIESPLKGRIKQSRILKTSLHHSRISPENRLIFKQRLNKIDESIQYIKDRHNQFNGISSNSYKKMCEMINKTEYMSVDHNQNIQIPLIKLIKPEQIENNENSSNLVQKLATQTMQWSESKKKQRSKLEQSVYYKTNKWQKARLQILQNFSYRHNNTLYSKKYMITQLKIPYLRHNSKQMFMALKQKNYHQLLKHLSYNKSFIHEVDNSLMTPLHISCQQGLYDITKMLLRFKADVNALDKNKKSPLYYALSNGHTEVVKMLLIHDAFPYSDNNCNYSQFFPNKVMKELFRVAKRIFTLMLICPKNKRNKMKEYLEINFLNEYSLPKNLLA
ncbi:unnamed protein product [Paramecium pentaurelia]|uniref:Uncharacterized protein n=1 Tax=Paramecium pentaurelia TaxID=43138 RepID=A0A8S1VSQ1_9CILI|nr:unnamed protein product [Paramecium pentaurelia]